MYFLDVLSGKGVQPASNDVVTSDRDENEAPINPAKIAELNRLVGMYDIYQSIKPEHSEALQKCIVLMRGKFVILTCHITGRVIVFLPRKYAGEVTRPHRNSLYFRNS